MSLQEKLSKLKEQKALNIEQENQAQQDQSLQPIRDHIKELEEQKRTLDLLIGSLGLASSKDTGPGMREYADEKIVTAKKEEGAINEMLEQHKDVLTDVGVDSIDSLVEHPDFGEESEVLSYKKSKKELADVQESDTALEARLLKLGISVEGTFSYDTAEKAIVEKKKAIDSMLIEEKLKTPEGKQEAIEMIAETLKESLPSMEIAKNDEKNLFQIRFNGEKYCNILVENGAVKFEGWNTNQLQLLPKGIEKFEEVYGPDVVRDALKHAYETTIEKAIKSYDAKNEYSYSLLQQIEANNPKEGGKARDALRDFDVLQNTARSVLQQKSEELKSNGIEFDPVFATGYGGRYEDFIALNYADTVEDIRGALDDTDIFPPKIDFVKLQEAIAKQKNKLQQFVDAVQGLSTQEDVDRFLGRNGSGNDAVLSKVRLDINRFNTYDLKYALKESPTTDKGSANNYGKTPIEKLRENKRYSEAKYYLEKKISTLENYQQKAIGKMGQAIDLRLKQKEFQKISTGYKSIGDFEDGLKTFEIQKKDAIELLSKLANLNLGVGEEEQVNLVAGRIEVPRIYAEMRAVQKELDNENQNEAGEYGLLKQLSNLKNTIKEHESNEPKWIGVSKWKKDLADYQTAQNTLEKTIQEKKALVNDLSNQSVQYLPTVQYSAISTALSKETMQGTAKEVLTAIQDKLREIIDQKPDEKQLKVYQEYKELEAKIKESN